MHKERAHAYVKARSAGERCGGPQVKDAIHRPYRAEHLCWSRTHSRRLGVRLVAAVVARFPQAAAADEPYLMRVWVTMLAHPHGQVPPALYDDSLHCVRRTVRAPVCLARCWRCHAECVRWRVLSAAGPLPWRSRAFWGRCPHFRARFLEPRRSSGSPPAGSGCTHFSWTEPSPSLLMPVSFPSRVLTKGRDPRYQSEEV